VDMIVGADFPVFSRFTTPQDSTGRWELVAHGDVVLEIGGVRVGRGDWIVADRDGIVVIPRGVVEDVITAAEEKAATENEIRKAVRGGKTPLDAHQRYGTFWGCVRVTADHSAAPARGRCATRRPPHRGA